MADLDEPFVKMLVSFLRMLIDNPIFKRRPALQNVWMIEDSYELE